MNSEIEFELESFEEILDDMTDRYYEMLKGKESDDVDMIVQQILMNL